MVGLGLARQSRDSTKQRQLYYTLFCRFRIGVSTALGSRRPWAHRAAGRAVEQRAQEVVDLLEWGRSLPNAAHWTTGSRFMQRPQKFPVHEEACHALVSLHIGCHRHNMHLQMHIHMRVHMHDICKLHVHEHIPILYP